MVVGFCLNYRYTITLRQSNKPNLELIIPIERMSMRKINKKVNSKVMGFQKARVEGKFQEEFGLVLKKLFHHQRRQI